MDAARPDACRVTVNRSRNRFAFKLCSADVLAHLLMSAYKDRGAQQCTGSVFCVR